MTARPADPGATWEQGIAYQAWARKDIEATLKELVRLRAALEDASQVWIVMSNDFPDAVFQSRAAAEAYCHKENENDKIRALKNRCARIFYRCYNFEVRR